MKGVQVFGAITAAFVLLALIAWATSGRSYRWEPTFDTDDDEPFGCELFDRLVNRSMGDRYRVDSNRRLLRELTEGHGDAPQGWLFTEYQLTLSEREVDELLSLVRRGDRVMVATTSLGSHFTDKVGLGINSWLQADRLERQMSRNRDLMPIVWMDTTGCYRRQEYLMDEVLLESTIFTRDSLEWTFLARNDYGSLGSPLAATLKMGGGELIVVSTPLLFTNYGMLKGRGAEYVFRLLSRFGQLPVQRVRLSTQLSQADSRLAVLDFIKTQPPLWWAWCLSILLAVLFMLTNARRRQRVMPVITPPQNHSLEFVRLIGTLYAQQGNHADLLEKKFRYTAERLRRELHIDITNPQEDRYSAAVIAQNTPLQADEAAQTLTDVRRQLDSRLPLSAAQMRHYVDRLAALLYNPSNHSSS